MAHQTRLDWLDRIKGLAILGIVVFHFFQNYRQEFPLLAVLAKQGAKVGYAGVDIFFVIAGFTTSYMLAAKINLNTAQEIKINWKSWLFKRIERIYPTYLLAAICAMLLYYFFLPQEKFNSVNLVLSFLGLAGYKFQTINPGFWFFTVLLQAYLVIPLLFQVTQGKSQKILIWAILIGVLTKVACYLTMERENIYFYLLQNNFLGSYSFQVFLGLYWGLIFSKKKCFRPVDYQYSILLFFLGLIIYTVLINMGIVPVYMLGFDLLFTPFIVIFLHFILTKLSQISTFFLLEKFLFLLSLLGFYSYQIYLIHQPLYFVTLPFLTQILTFTPYLKVALIFLISMALLTIYVMAFTYLEKLVRKFFFQPLLSLLHK